MVSVTFRFYAGLNDFLAPARRRRAFDAACARRATAKHMVEALGVPHTEVALLLIEGEPAGLDRILADGERVAVYPRFSTLPGDDPVLARLPPRMRFVADAHLGALARLLRMAGFDTLYDPRADDAAIAAAGALGERIVLTRDRDLLKRRAVAYGCYVRELKGEAQLREIVERLDLGPLARPFTLCLSCNAPLRPVPREEVEQGLPPAVRRAQHAFRTCDLCGGVFWKGSHWKRMCAVLAGTRLAAPCEDD